jgi:hypothetical protein
MCVVLVTSPPTSALGGGFAAFAFGAAALSCYPLASAMMNSALPPHFRLSGNRLVVLLAALGGCTGPLATGMIAPWIGPAGGFAVIGCAALVTMTALLACRAVRS